MFERYTEKARRVIFFARYEASQFGQPYIETEHLLLGVLREDKALTNRFLKTHSSVESIRRQIEKHTTIREKVSTSVDLPLSNECKRVLAYAAEEAERLKHKHIGSEHLLLGLLREENCFARQILKERHIELEKVREELAKAEPDLSRLPQSAVAAAATRNLIGVYADLTQKAIHGELEPVVARDLELGSVIEVLCRKERRNPILLGERGVGKTAIVEALAQRIAEGKVPPELAEMKILVPETEVLAASAPSREQFEDLAKAMGTVANVILFVDQLHPIAEGTGKDAAEKLVGVLRFAMQSAEVRCIVAATEQEYKSASERYPDLDNIFRPLHVKPLGPAAALDVLKARKERLEKFHEVVFADEALQCAVEQADCYLKEKLLPGKALELLDAAGAAVKVREGSAPLEIIESRKKIKFIVHRMDSAIGSHEFEKAKFYSEEERKERLNLLELRKKYGLDDAIPPAVTRTDVEQAILKLNSYPYDDKS
jgi:ATP-dependent Clp protease ATP-binding subunit ClpC